MNNNQYSHRQSSQTVRFTDSNGNALANKDIEFKLVNHEFLFGSGAFDSLPATAEETPGNIDFYQDKIVTKKEFYQDRVNKWLGIFNYGTIPFYWGGFEPVEGEPLTNSRMNAAKYLQSKGVRVKGHPLCWHTVCADWLLKYDNKTIMDKQLERINRDVTAFKGVVDMWDVINETVIMPVFDKYDNAITRICNEYGRINLIKEVFAAAKAANPDAILLINDFNLSEKYAEVIRDCLEAGVPISAIGLQTHQHQGYLGKEKFLEFIERFKQFGLPLHFTENTLISGDIMPSHIVDLNDWQVDEWPTTPEGEERQLKEWKEVYETVFADPAVEAITGWDFADGAWLHAPSGIIREDGSIKPVYNELKRLVKEEWTSKGTIHTDENGYAVLSGYRGEYELSCDGKNAKYTLKKDCKENGEILL